jgi:glutathione synthase/RimK-type ligase-like ATP-grasp enzyme
MYARLWCLLDDDDAPTKVVNAPAVQLSNSSKPYQSIIIQEQGLDVPDTCITSDEAVARAFLEKHAAVVYKSISGERSIVKRVDDASRTKLSRIRYCPVQFQECVEGFNVRVHVVGEQTFATRICSDAVDYRYAEQEGKTSSLAPYELSPDVSEKCVRVAHALRLPFVGIDLMISEDGRTVCFEANPSPGYSYYERHTGQRISHALADYLASRERS